MKNWDHLRVFLAVARHGTVTNAAVEENVSRATILRKVEQLENELGVRLFKRLQSGYQLSDAGKSLLKEAESAEQIVTEIAFKYQGVDQKLEGIIRVTQPDNDLLDLYRIYAEFNRAYPNIKLQVIPTIQELSLNKREVDVAIRLTMNPGELLVGRELKLINTSAYASRWYLDHFGSNASLADYDWLIWHHPSETLEQSTQYRWLAKRVEKPNVIMQTSSISGIYTAIRSGMGVGFSSQEVIQHASDMVLIPDTHCESDYKLWLLCHRDMKHVARIRCFMQFVYDRLPSELKP